MTSNSFQNPFVQKIRVLTHLLVLSISLNVAFGATALYHYAKNDNGRISLEHLPYIELKKEHSALLQSFFQKNFGELVGELSNKAEIADGYKVCDLALGILVSYNYLDISKALMGESLEEREVMFIHTEGGERFPICLYPDAKEYHFSLIKGFIKDAKYPLTSEGLFAEIKIQKENAGPDLCASFMLSKEYIAIYTFVYGFFNDLDKHQVLSMLLSGGFEDIERFYYLYLENMDKPKDMMRHFFKTYVCHGSADAADMWIDIDEEYILHQLNNDEITKVINLTSKESFLHKVQRGVRSNEVRELAKTKSKIPVLEEVVSISAKEKEKPQLSVKRDFEHYTVKRGDSLWKIAGRHGISIEDIQRFNDLESDLLREGQMLKLPLK